MTRVPALEVLGLVALRRGEPSAARPAGPARGRSRSRAGSSSGSGRSPARGRRPRGSPATTRASTRRRREAYDLALRCGHAWDVGELAVWRARAGCLAEPPRVSGTPHALELAGEHRAASRLWRERGFPYAEALALAGAGDEQSLLAALALLDRLGASATAAVVRRRLRAAGAAHVPRGPRPGHAPPSGRAHARGRPRSSTSSRTGSRTRRSPSGSCSRGRPSSTTSLRSSAGSVSPPAARPSPRRAAWGSSRAPKLGVRRRQDGGRRPMRARRARSTLGPFTSYREERSG